MKRSALIALSAVATAVGCSTSTPWSHAGTTHIVVTGTTGSVVTGFYVQHGLRVAVSNAVPWSVDIPRLSSLEFRKLHPSDIVIMDLRYGSVVAHARFTKTLESGVVGTRIVVRNGFSVSTF